MLDTAKIAELSAATARKWIAVERVLVEPMVDSQGEVALRVTLVLDPETVERVTGDQSRHTYARGALHVAVAPQRAARDWA